MKLVVTSLIALSCLSAYAQTAREAIAYMSEQEFDRTLRNVADKMNLDTPSRVDRDTVLRRVAYSSSMRTWTYIYEITDVVDPARAQPGLAGTYCQSPDFRAYMARGLTIRTQFHHPILAPVDVTIRGSDCAAPGKVVPAM